MTEETGNKTERINTILGKIKLPKLTENDAIAMRDPISKKEIEEKCARSRWIPK